MSDVNHAPPPEPPEGTLVSINEPPGQPFIKPGKLKKPKAKAKKKAKKLKAKARGNGKVKAKTKRIKARKQGRRR